MKIQLANITYHRVYAGCCPCHLAKISSKDDYSVHYIECPDFIPQPCHNAFKIQLFNDGIFKL